MTRASNNPFRVERVHALRYQLHDTDWDQLLTRLHTMRHRAAIIGPHGSGKTTMLIELERQLQQRGMRTVMLFTHTSHGRSLPGDWRNTLQHLEDSTLVLADGYDLLHAWARWQLRHHVKQLVVTTHGRCSLNTLFECEARAETLVWLVEQLTHETMPREQAQMMLNAHQGNMREVIRRLYDEGYSPKTSVSG